MSRTKDGKNLRLAGLFIVVVLGLIFVSALFKFFLIVKTSRFDGSHNFIVSFVGKDREAVVSFSPQNRSLSILDIDSVYKHQDLTKTFEIPIDGTIVSQNPNSSNISSMLLKSAFSFGQSLKKLTILDVLRLFLFSKTIPQNNIYERQLSAGLNDAQKSTVINLSLTDASIYQENQTIQVINASNVQGLGSRLATLIANIGGNVILVSTSDETLQNSKILYYGDKTYTVKKISSYLGIPAESSAQRGVGDVIITIGKDKANSSSF
jgi:hypothetical protein